MVNVKIPQPCAFGLVMGFVVGCGIGIRTPTNRVRVCRATVTQFRNASERMILYQILFFLSILFYDFVKKFTSALLLRNADAYPPAVGLRFSPDVRALLRLARERTNAFRARDSLYIPRLSRSIAPFSRRDTCACEIPISSAISICVFPL